MIVACIHKDTEPSCSKTPTSRPTTAAIITDKSTSDKRLSEKVVPVVRNDPCACIVAVMLLPHVRRRLRPPHS